MYYFQGSNGNYLSFIKIPAWLSVICGAELAKPFYVRVHTDHLGTLDSHNARSKFALHSSTLMKNPIRWGEGGSHFPGGNVFRGSLCFRVYFFSYWYF